MSADIATSLYSWSTTAGSNQPQGSTAISTNLDDNLRQIQAVVRSTQARDTISSASTCDIGAKDAMSLDVTGTTTITSLGTVSAGIRKWLTFSGALTLTHNATSLILPTAANITTSAGASGCFESLGSGNWRCLSYSKPDGTPISVQSFSLSDLSSATANKTLTNTTYAQNWGWVFTSAGQKGLTLTGKSSGTGTAGHVLCLDGSSASLSTQVENIFRVIGGVSGSATDVFNVTQFGGTIYGNDNSTTGGSWAIRAGTGPNSAGDGMVSFRSASRLGTSSSLVADSTQIILSSQTKAVIDAKRMYFGHSNGVPTISAGGGAGATIAGCDAACEVVFGTGSPTSVTIRFANAWSATPQIVMVNGTQAGATYSYAANTTTVQISCSAGMSSGSKISVMCMGLQ